QVNRVVNAPINGQVIPHGIGKHIKKPEEGSRLVSAFSVTRPFRIVYVSTVSSYKHHVNVIASCVSLHEAGYPITLEILGAVESGMRRKLRRAIEAATQGRDWIVVHGERPYAEIDSIYRAADLGLFASSCENLPIILLEKMAAGLPVACSARASMPEVLG